MTKQKGVTPMKRLQKLNEYRTPEEWKARAEKIADGKGIYASVKRTSAVKWAAAAAVAAVIGFEGYSLLSTSVRQTETDPTPAPQISKKDDNSHYITRQKIENYYDKDTSDLYKENLTDHYKTNGCELFLTNQNGCAYAKSDILYGNGTSPSMMAFINEDTFSAFDAASDGYIIDGSTLTALVRFTSAAGSSNDLYDDINPIEDSITIHTCITDRDGNEITPLSVDFDTQEGMISYYTRVEITLPEGETFDNKTTDIHFYKKAAVSDEKDITDQNDTIYGGYHYDMKIFGTGSGASSQYDAYDTLAQYYNDDMAYQLAGSYHYSGFKSELGVSSDFVSDPDDRIDTSESVNYFERDKSYPQYIDIDCTGYVTDGISLSMFFRRKGHGTDMLKDFVQNYETKAYLRSTGELLDTEIKMGNANDDQSGNIMISVIPGKVLDGDSVELHFLSTDEQYSGKNALHYVFTFNIEKGLSSTQFGEVQMPGSQKLKDSGKELRSGDITVKSSPHGLLFSATDELDKAYDEALGSSKSNVLIAGISQTNYIHDGSTWHMAAGDNVEYWQFIKANAENDDQLLLYRVSSGGKTVGYYMSRKYLAGATLSAAVLPEEMDAAKEILGDGFDEEDYIG